MRHFFLLSLFIGASLFAKNNIPPLYAKSGYCYSILTDVGYFTPVSEAYFQTTYHKKRCNLFNPSPLFTTKKAYIGCYRQEKTAQKKVTTLSFHFQNPEIIYHKVYDGTPYVIFPNRSYIDTKKALKHLDSIYKQYTINKVLRKFPRTGNGESLEIYDMQKTDFLPTFNLFSIYNFNRKKYRKVLLLRDGDYSIEDVYKKLHNPTYINKIDNKTYEINIPLVVLPSASLVFKNKTIHLQTKPNAVFIIYFGKLYASNSTFLTWDKQKKRYCKREHVPDSKILYTNYEKPRPYFLGLTGSRTYFVNNIFKGLGFHSTSATFGLSVLFPKIKDFYPQSQAFYYFISHDSPPSGAYIGNDIYDGIMAIYTNGGKNIVYLGNYTHDNVIYNFDPHDYSTGLVIAKNLSVGAKKAHGIIISRGCNNNYIASNISINNNANGIMVDRSSNHNLIYNNLTYGNGFMGISCIESKNLLVKENVSVGNYIDGIMVRNSLNFEASGNTLMYNGRNGIEVMMRDIDAIPGRNFSRDPYAKASSAIIKNNIIKNNYNANIMAKNSVAINIAHNTIPNYIGMGGDLNFFYGDILRTHGNFTLYGLGFPYKAQSSDLISLNPHAYKMVQKIYRDISNRSNDYFGTHLGGLYAANESLALTETELKRAASIFSKGALEFLGFVSLSDAREGNFRDKKLIIRGVSYLIENAILSGNPSKFHQIDKVRLFIPYGEDYIEKAYHIAIERMSKGILFESKEYGRCPLCNNSLYDKYKILGKLKIFHYAYKEANQKNFLKFCQYITQDYTLFTSSAKTYFNAIIRAKNSIKDRVNRYNRGIIQKVKKDDLCNKYLIKQKKVTTKMLSMMQYEKQKRVKSIEPKLEELLRGINRYRVRKISKKQLLRMINNGIKNDPKEAQFTNQENFHD